MKNVDFVESVLDISTKLFRQHADNKIVFVTAEHELIKPKSADPADGVPLKSETEIFQDVIENLTSIAIAGYSLYLLSCSTETTKQIKRLNDEETKQPVNATNASNTSQTQKQSTVSSSYDQLCTDYFKDIDALADTENCDQYCALWSQRLSSNRFMDYCLSIVEYSDPNFDDVLNAKSFNKLLFMLLKLLEDSQNIEQFLQVNGFKKLLNLNSTKRGIIDASKTYFSSIVLRLVEDESALLEITENIVRKSLYFKHDEEFAKDNKTKDSIATKPKHDKSESATLTPLEEHKHEHKQKSVDSAECTALKRDNVSLHAFKN